MLFDITQRLYKKGDKLTISNDGRQFAIEIVETTCVDFERKYLAKYTDGSKRWVFAYEISLPC